MNGNNRQPLLWVGLSLMMIVMVLCAGYLFNWFSPVDNSEFTLPPPPESGSPLGESGAPLVPTDSASATPSRTPMYLDVTIDNVQQFVDEMSRPEEYQCEWRVEWFWPTGSHSARRQVYVRDGYTKIEIYNPDGSLLQHLISGGGHLFLFGPSGGFWQPEQGDFTPESGAALPAYEVIGDLDKSALLDADFDVWENLPCIYVSFLVEGTDYTDAYWLSVEDGLPIKMERLRNGSPIFRCVRVSLTLTRPPDEVFLLPNKEFAWDVE